MTSRDRSPERTQATKTGRELERLVANAYRAMGARKVEHDVELAGHQIDVYVELETLDRGLHRVAVEVKDYTSPVGIKIVSDFSDIVDRLRRERLIDEGVVVSAAGFSRPARNAAKKHDIRLLEPADLDAMVTEVQATRPTTSPPSTILAAPPTPRPGEGEEEDERALQSDAIASGESSPITLSSPSLSKEPVRERRKRSRLIADHCVDVMISFDLLLEQTERPQDWAGIRLRGKETSREGYFVIVRRDGRVEIVLVGPGSQERILGSYTLPHMLQTMHFAITLADTRISVKLKGTEILRAEAGQYTDVGGVFLEVCRATATFSNLWIGPIHFAGAPIRNLGDEFRYDAFISYSHHDKEWVRGWLLPRLEEAGLRVCIDFRDFEPGLPSLVNMENAVERSRKTLIVLTPDWVASEWTTFEGLLIQTDDPAGRKARMIPLRLKSCEPPKRIAMLTYVDFTQLAEAEFQLGRLVAAIRGEPLPPWVRNRRIDAAAPSHAEVGQHIDLLVQVRFPDSPLLGIKDWPTRQKPTSIEQASEPVALEFPIDPRTGKLGSARLQIRVVTPDFRIEGAAQQLVKVPPDRYSKRISFLLTAIKVGSCRINVEVYSVDHICLAVCRRGSFGSS